MTLIFKPAKYDPSIDTFGRWDSELGEAPGVDATWTGDFETDGMVCVYQRVEATDIDPKLAYNLQVWRASDGRLLSKVWVDGVSLHFDEPLFQDWFEVVGYELKDFPHQDERWVPWVLRDMYIGWALMRKHVDSK